MIKESNLANSFITFREILAHNVNYEQIHNEKEYFVLYVSIKWQNEWMNKDVEYKKKNA